MSRLLLPLCALVVQPARADDVRTALEQLESPAGAERLAAERWLAAHLGADDLALIAERATAAGPEVLRRLEGALGSGDRHFALAALLAADTERPVRALGEAALLELTSRWLGDEGLDPVPSVRLLGVLRDRRERRPEYRATLRGEPFEELTDRLVRLAGGDLVFRPGSDPLAVVLDPLLSGKRPEPGEVAEDGQGPPWVEGDFLQLLEKACEFSGAALEGFGLDSRLEQRVWIHAVPPELAGRRRADELVVAWVRDLLLPREIERRSAAARALADCGWPAPLSWLERRWLREGDVAALEGLLVAASHGRVVPALAAAHQVRELLAEADAALAARSPAGDARAALVMRALRCVPPSGVAGDDLSALCVEGFEGLNERPRLLRVLVLAGMGSAPPAWRALLQAELSRPAAGATAAYRLACVEALAATGPGEVGGAGALADAVALFELAIARGALEALVDRLAEAHLAPPPAWRDPSALTAGWSALPRALVAEAWLRGGADEATAGRHWRVLCEQGAGEDEPAIARRLQRIAAVDGERLALALGPDAGRLLLLAGLLPAARHASILAEITPQGRAATQDLLLLGALAAGPVGDQARTALIQQVRASLQSGAPSLGRDDPWVPACERAWRELLVAGEDDQAESLRLDVGSLLRRHRHALREGFQHRRWPRPPGLECIPLETLEPAAWGP